MNSNGRCDFQIVENMLKQLNDKKRNLIIIILPIHTEIENSHQDYIINEVINFFK